MRFAPGILPSQAIEALAAAGHIRVDEPLAADQVQPASLDLRLGRRVFRVRASFLPGRDIPVSERIARLTLHEIDLTRGAVLETGAVYIAELLEHLSLPPGLAAAANPKSSTGRLDVFTRVIANGAREFDQIEPGYEGPLYLEISTADFSGAGEDGVAVVAVAISVGAVRLEIRNSPHCMRGTGW